MPDSGPPPRGCHVAGCAQLAVKHAFGLTIWREVDPVAGKYRVNLRLGNNSGPYPHWVQEFPLAHSIDEAVDDVARMAWGYFTATGYQPGDEPIDDRDIARTPAKMIIDMKAEREAKEIREMKRGRR